ncbi:MAG: dihydrofolate reductase [Lachnospiraceae bacterium]|nr:dihydrofolate reductase [Lachnospiraceae bacterium]
MKAIVAVDENWAIGNKGNLLVRIPADQKFFREETTGKVIILGRKTIETFPNQSPLKNRTNIVLSTRKDLEIPGATVVHSVEEAVEYCRQYDQDTVYCIGGASVYREFLPYCDTVHVTKIDHAYEADAYFPNLDQDPDWEITADSDEQVYFDLTYHFLRYERKRK